ncbi:hypothetical protein COY95_04945 [Candidatus Woesearchaeota archaeon CG_4_10_14_0_8_um_filter_47_5]|nr:MAG: hypothetical protein COY95_04945 [Candidatus Woesearchaeota archaeon CG_4_10_14_0_8_um_filter_47_5]
MGTNISALNLKMAIANLLTQTNVAIVSEGDALFYLFKSLGVSGQYHRFSSWQQLQDMFEQASGSDFVPSDVTDLIVLDDTGGAFAKVLEQRVLTPGRVARQPIVVYTTQNPRSVFQQVTDSGLPTDNFFVHQDNVPGIFHGFNGENYFTTDIAHLILHGIFTLAGCDRGAYTSTLRSATEGSQLVLKHGQEQWAFVLDPKKKGTILYLEDDPTTAGTIIPELEKAGYNVIHLDNGRHGMALMDHFGPRIDIIVSDMIMHDNVKRQLPYRLTGVAFAELIAALGFGNTPIILTTGLGAHLEAEYILLQARGKQEPVYYVPKSLLGTHPDTYFDILLGKVTLALEVYREQVATAITTRRRRFRTPFLQESDQLQDPLVRARLNTLTGDRYLGLTTSFQLFVDQYTALLRYIPDEKQDAIGKKLTTLREFLERKMKSIQAMIAPDASTDYSLAAGATLNSVVHDLNNVIGICGYYLEKIGTWLFNGTERDPAVFPDYESLGSIRLLHEQYKSVQHAWDAFIDATEQLRISYGSSNVTQSLEECIKSAVEQEQGEHHVLCIFNDDLTGVEVYASLGQILRQIIRNATQFSEYDKPIGVYASREGEYCVIRVEDKGTGLQKLTAHGLVELPVNEYPTLFESGVTARLHGTGEGLAICKGLAGELTSKGVPVEIIPYSKGMGKGSVFTVRYPLLES